MVNAASGLAAQVLGTRVNGLRAWQEQIDRSAHQRRFQNDRKQLDHNYHRRQVDEIDIIGQQSSTPVVRNSHRAEQPMPHMQKSAVDLWANFINTNANRRAVFEAIMLMNSTHN
jgi:hypothetical protein